jgi:hypothetical protein
MTSVAGLKQFLRSERQEFVYKEQCRRTVYISELADANNGLKLSDYFSDKAPLFYQSIHQITERLAEDGFVSAIRDVLVKLPTAESFKESHFAEIASGLFATEILGLKKLYSKLSILTSQNANAFKMDLVLYDPKSDPVEFVFGEVKSSMKSDAEGLPAGHDKSCFADMFNSLREYSSTDLNFDLSAAKDYVDKLDESEKIRVRKALGPYSSRQIRYTGFAIIDFSTKNDDETAVLAKRKSGKQFDVDLICVDGISVVAHSTYKYLESLQNVLNQRNP